VIMQDGGTLTNAGTISGGDGGAAGTGGTAPYGTGGAGIVGADISILNSGTISGGLAGDGITRADAITFTGGVNRLGIISGSLLVGTVDATADTHSTLELSGDVDGTFDVSTIGDTAQYRGFEYFAKTGTSTWRLTGTGAQNWFIQDGTLVGDTNSFGGNLEFAAG